jgi:hypothetical protein
MSKQSSTIVSIMWFGGLLRLKKEVAIVVLNAGR